MKKIVSIFLSLIFLFGSQVSGLPQLSSYPSAKATIFLDFDGQTVEGTMWNSGSPLYCAAPALNDVQITEIFNRVSEDYRPFNINITTDSVVFLKAPVNQRIRIIITPTSSWYPGVGGVSFTGSFIWGDDTPGFVFADRLGNSPKMIAECCTHESGHTVGLSHQAKYNTNCALVTTYNEGLGTGETGWAPVMGNSYYRNLSGWNNGPTPSGCTADQDNLSIITTRNGFTYREDDHRDDPAQGATPMVMDGPAFSSEGIITTNTDKDAFKISLPQDGNVHINAVPYSVGPNNEGADLDIKATLLNGAMQVVKVYDPEAKLDVTIDTTLTAGDYYLVIQGTGNENTSEYGSLGSYTVSGLYSALRVLPVSQVLLSGNVLHGKHELSWNIVTDVPLQSVTLESSSNGTSFTSLASPGIQATSFSYAPLISQAVFYRLKVVAVSGQVVYSNIIALQPADAVTPVFTFSTLVNNELKINATQSFEYHLADMNGRIVKTGKAQAGLTNIDIHHSPNGIYVLQLICNSQRTTQRIVKL